MVAGRKASNPGRDGGRSVVEADPVEAKLRPPLRFKVPWTVLPTLAKIFRPERAYTIAAEKNDFGGIVF